MTEDIRYGFFFMVGVLAICIFITIWHLIGLPVIFAVPLIPAWAIFWLMANFQSKKEEVR